MMRKIPGSIFLIILLNIFTSTMVFSDQIAITSDGKKVFLKNDGTWIYIKEEVDELKLKIIAVNKEVKDSLYYYIYNHPGIFTNEFHIGISIEWSADETYKNIMGTFKSIYTQAIYWSLVKEFGRRTADNMKWLFEHWELWEKFCK